MAAVVETGVINIERGLPWHRLGEYRQGFMTVDEALREAQLDWGVEKQPLYIYANGTAIEVPDQFAIVRDFDSKPLGVVGKRYHEIQNHESLNFLDEIVGRGEAIYDSAWSLRGGRVICATIELPETKPIAEGEEMRRFITVTNSHDGSGQLMVMNVNTRVVCMNTLNAATAEAKKAKTVYKRKHTRNALTEASVAEAREVVNAANVYNAWIHKTAEALIKEAFSKKKFERMAADLLLVKDTSERDRRFTPQSEAKYEELMANYVNSPNIANVRGTKWGAWNAVTEWVDYGTESNKFRSTREDSEDFTDKRIESLMFGAGLDLKTEAMEYLLVA